MGQVFRCVLGRGGFYYSRYLEFEGSAYSAENTFHSVYFHKKWAHHKPKTSWCSATTTSLPFCGGHRNGHVVLNTSTGTDGNSLHVKSLPNQGEWTPIVDGFTHHSSMVDHVNGRLYVLTDIDAPRYRLIAADPSDSSNQDKWQDVLPQTDDLRSRSVWWGLVGGLSAQRLQPRDAVRLGRVHARVVELPYAVGSV